MGYHLQNHKMSSTPNATLRRQLAFFDIRMEDPFCTLGRLWVKAALLSTLPDNNYSLRREYLHRSC